jgi:hypothetical protein
VELWVWELVELVELGLIWLSLSLSLLRPDTPQVHADGRRQMTRDESRDMDESMHHTPSIQPSSTQTPATFFQARQRLKMTFLATPSYTNIEPQTNREVEMAMPVHRVGTGAADGAVL